MNRTSSLITPRDNHLDVMIFDYRVYPFLVTGINRYFVDFQWDMVFDTLEEAVKCLELYNDGTGKGQQIFSGDFKIYTEYSGDSFSADYVRFYSTSHKEVNFINNEKEEFLNIRYKL